MNGLFDIAGLRGFPEGASPHSQGSIPYGFL